MNASEIIDVLETLVPEASPQALTPLDESINPTILVPVDQVQAVCRALHDAPGLEFVAFTDVTATDFHARRDPRFEVVYHFVSPHRRARVRVKVQVNPGQPVPTVHGIWRGAGWCEREVFDLFGIEFAGHDDLRRLMMPEDWEGHPLRKDYPVQVRKDAETFMPLQMSEEEFKANVERDRRVRPKPR
jgi:NADH-quinone oxidoreductase subunit C